MVPAVWQVDSSAHLPQQAPQSGMPVAFRFKRPGSTWQLCHSWLIGPVTTSVWGSAWLGGLPREGFPGRVSQVVQLVKTACQFRRHKRHGFDPWVGKIPQRRAWQPFQHPRMRSLMDRGAWWASVYGATALGMTEHALAGSGPGSPSECGPAFSSHQNPHNACEWKALK